MDTAFGQISPYEMVFIFLITFIVVGPRRIIRGVKVINEWVHNKFSRVQKKAADSANEFARAAREAKESTSTTAAKPTTSKKTQNVMRGLGRMAGYYRDLNKEKEKEKEG